MKSIQHEVYNILNKDKVAPFDCAQGLAGYGDCKHCHQITKAIWRRRISIFALIVLIGALPVISWIVVFCFTVNIGLGIVSLIGVYAGLHWEKRKACSRCHKYYDKWFDNFYGEK